MECRGRRVRIKERAVFITIRERARNRSMEIRRQRAGIRSLHMPDRAAYIPAPTATMTMAGRRAATRTAAPRAWVRHHTEVAGAVVDTPVAVAAGMRAAGGTGEDSRWSLVVGRW